jgi:hypothetical protein
MFNFDPNDPRQMGLLMAAARMLEPGPGGVAGSLSRAVPTGLMGYQTTRGLNDRRAEEEQQRRMREFHIEEANRARADREGMRGAFQTAFAPNPNMVAGDDEGNAMPQAPGGGGVPEFLKLAGRHMDPMQAIGMMPQPERPQYHNVGGSLIETRGGKATPVYQAPDKPDFKAGQTRELKSGRRVLTQEYDGKSWKTISVGDLDRADGPEKPEKPPAGYRWDGANLAPIKGGPADPANKASDTERMASGYASRMQAAEKRMAPIEQKGGDAKPGIRETMLMAAGQETLANALPSLLGGRSSERQSYRQAQEDWVRAKLRKESGAVIADAEMDREIRMYFPQIGDGPKQIADKAASRKIAVDGMRTSAGSVQPAASVDDLLKKYLAR